MKICKFFDFSLLVLFCLPLFFLLHGINENYGLIPWIDIWRLAALYLGITAVLLFMSERVFKKSTKAGVFSFYLLCIFFFFDALHDVLKEVVGESFFSSYKFLIPAIVLSVCILATWLFRTRRNLFRIKQYYSVLCSIFFAVELLTLVVHSFRGDGRKNDLSLNRTPLPSAAYASVKPDIFFIVFDGFTSNECLKEQFHYDNSEIDSVFLQNHFFLSSKSKSNYSITPFSLSSTFSLDYLTPKVQEWGSTSKSFLQAMRTFKQNRVVNYFHHLGYQIKNFGCFDLEDVPTQTIPYFDYLPFRQINNQTLSGSIDRDISFNWKLKNIFTGEFRIPESYKQYKRYHLYRNASNFDSLLAELKRGSDSPRFVYAHLMLPHEPFFLDSIGHTVSDTAMIRNSIKFKDGYLAQLKYASLLLKKLIPVCASNNGDRRIVVIEGDHGFRDYSPETPPDRVFSNLNAYYFSDGDYSLLYDGISPVNTFRVILNKYFGGKYSMLKDTFFFIHPPKK